jgi:EmrB/QacA subfamily drug resistance transporter
MNQTAPITGGRRWAVLAVLCLGLLVTGIDGTIVNVALPTLVRQLHASSSQLQWVVDAYTIVFASFLLIAGSTGDRLGRKGAFAAGLVVFGTGSLACSLTHSANTLILTRGFQGLGAAFIMPSTLSIITNVFTDPGERARAISLWAGVSGLGVAIGPLSGGYLLGHFWWGSIFLVNVPIVLVALVGVAVLVPNSKDEHAPAPDVLGTALSTTGLICLLYGIIEGPGEGWSQPKIIVAFAAAVVLLTGFTLWERHTDHPVLNVRFFANPRFTAASVAVTLVFFAMFGSLFFVSQFLQFVLGLSPLASGVRLLPVAVVLMVAAPLSAKLVERLGTKIVVALGLILVGVALLVFSRATTTSGYGLIAVVLVIVGLGMGFAMAPATDSIMGSLPPEQAGVGSAVNDTTREIGGALGVAIMGSLTASAYAHSISDNPQFVALARQAPKAAAAVRSSVGSAAVVASSLPKATAALLTLAANHAFVHALDRAVIIAALVAFAGAVVAAVFLPANAETAETTTDVLTIGAAQRLPTDAFRRRSFAAATLGLLADAGMSSLSFNALASRSGISTATLERYWTSRVDAVVLAMSEVFAEHPIPDTGDLRADLIAHLTSVSEALTAPSARAVIGALAATAAGDPELESALHDRLVGPRRAELADRIQRGINAGQASAHLAPGVVADVLMGPLYLRALITGEPIGPEFIESLVDLAISSPAPARA